MSMDNFFWIKIKATVDFSVIDDDESDDESPSMSYSSPQFYLKFDVTNYEVVFDAMLDEQWQVDGYDHPSLVFLPHDILDNSYDRVIRCALRSDYEFESDLVMDDVIREIQDATHRKLPSFFKNPGAFRNLLVKVSVSIKRYYHDEDSSRPESDSEEEDLVEEMMVETVTESNDHMQLDEKKVCAICLDDLFQVDDLKEKHDVSKLTRCGHVFHEGCVMKWLDGTPSCPLCRSQVLCLRVS